MSLYLRQQAPIPPQTPYVTPTPETTIRITPEEAFFSKHGILLILILILIIVIITLWLIGSKVGDTVSDGKKLPSGFPLYIVRNLFSSISLVLLGVGIYLYSRTGSDFDMSMLILFFVTACVCVMLYETYFELKEDPNGAALVIALAPIAILFMIFLTWSSSLWIKFFFFIPLAWFIFILVETIFYSHINGTTNNNV